VHTLVTTEMLVFGIWAEAGSVAKGGVFERTARGIRGRTAMVRRPASLRSPAAAACGADQADHAMARSVALAQQPARMYSVGNTNPLETDPNSPYGC
jgi:hypothetical protein